MVVGWLLHLPHVPVHGAGVLVVGQPALGPGTEPAVADQVLVDGGLVALGVAHRHGGQAVEDHALAVGDGDGASGHREEDAVAARADGDALGGVGLALGHEAVVVPAGLGDLGFGGCGHGMYLPCRGARSGVLPPSFSQPAGSVLAGHGDLVHSGPTPKGRGAV